MLSVTLDASLKMRWVHSLIILLTTHCVLSQVDDVEINNEVSATSPKIDLDSNLRKALLRALTELENEDTRDNNFQNDDGSESNIKKASASSVTIFSNGEPISSPVSSTTTTTTTENSVVILQKSEGVQQPSIATFERAIDDPEQILTSASSSFSNLPYQKSSEESKFPQVNSNSIDTFDKSTSRVNEIESTTLATSVSTEEIDAKVEDVPFFSAPLVAAFTVHQDELGLPKKVEPIYKTAQRTAEEVTNSQRIEAVRQQQERVKLEELRRQQEKIQQQFELEQRKTKLEQEILRLNLNLKQQQNLFLRQQEELRNRANAQQFLPFVNPSVNVQQPFSARPATQFIQGVALQPSISFDPLVEAGKLPLNAQILPVKGPVNFQSAFVPSQFDNFRQLNQGNRFFRQNTGIGNLGVNNDFTRNTNSFSIQQSLQPSSGNRFLRSNLESSLTAPQFFSAPPTQSNRFFRSNLESSFGSPSNINVLSSQQNYNNNQLSNLLYNSGAFRGKSPDDLSLISKVLSYNNNFENSVRLRQQPYVRNF